MIKPGTTVIPTPATGATLVTNNTRYFERIDVERIDAPLLLVNWNDVD